MIGRQAKRRANQALRNKTRIENKNVNCQWMKQENSITRARAGKEGEVGEERQPRMTGVEWRVAVIMQESERRRVLTASATRTTTTTATTMHRVTKKKREQRVDLQRIKESESKEMDESSYR